ncbi:hypothetical protein GE115_08730 [Agromyces sp. CFH 90414]|uniref:Uncharacterized protein n=1 Tax=Agromyces agglutinans TaxID=2662258 RepID=A0A6I2F5M6_9MICO|nr:hypothetical protein [Agromyces agglutinans]MRG59952.1 hypothetical protein [Agromyces agglutinans]
MTGIGDAVRLAILEAAVADGAVGSVDALDASATGDPATQLDRDGHLALIRASADAESEARSILRQAVESARSGGVSWSAIGAELGMTRQAAQQRFGDAWRADASPGVDPGGEPGDGAGDGAEYRWLGPVTAFDEMAELALAGRAGWRTVEAGMLRHRMVRTDTQWEHRRLFGRGISRREESDGWVVGCQMFPWTYLVRDLGTPAE